MIKTYAAPIAEDQVQPIVQYLVAAKESGDGRSWETAAVVVAKPEVSAAAIDRPGDANHGRALYMQSCASCHGADGRGQTQAAANQLPKPTDLTSGRFAAQAIAASITRGVPGTAMPRAAVHSGDDLGDLVTFVQRFEPHESSGTASPTADVKDLFARNCAGCHGATGMGDGIAAPPLARPPANFHQRRPTLDQATRVISDGVPGTAMAAWKSKLTESQRMALAEYVRTLYDGR
jgi:cbb3-type cytochrome c oxidase subunit III